MNELPTEVADTDNALHSPRAAAPEDDEGERAERLTKLRRSMADFEAGRYRPAKDVLRELAAEDGFTLED